MGKFFHVKNKREALFILVSVVLFILLLIYTIFSLSFLGKKVNEAMNLNLIKNDGITRFDFGKLEELKKK